MASFDASRSALRSEAESPTLQQDGSDDGDSISRKDSNGDFDEALNKRFPNIVESLQPYENTRRKALAEGAKDGGTWSVQTVLSLDGGGIRGLSTLLIVQALMNVIEKIEANTWPAATTSGDSELLEGDEVRREIRKLGRQVRTRDGELETVKESTFLPCHYFDFIAGTSTGGLIATMLGRMWMSADRALQEFKALTRDVYGVRYRNTARRMKHIIKGHKESEEDRVRELVKDKFGERPLLLPLQDDDRCKTIVCSFEQNYGKSSRVPYLFRSYGYAAHQDDRDTVDGKGDNIEAYTVTDVVRATACSPYYLTPVKLGSKKFCDAGLSWTNPTGEVWRELHAIHVELPPCLVLSIGSGYDPKAGKASRSRLRFWQPHRTRIERTTDRVNSSLAQISEDVHEYMEKMFRDRFDMQYFRLNANLNLTGVTSHHVHSWQQEVNELQKAITEATSAYLKHWSIQESLQECAESLVDLRRRRSRTVNWEAFAFGVRYKCRAKQQCSKKEALFDRKELKEHLQQAPEHLKVDYGEIKMLVDQGRVRSNE